MVTEIFKVDNSAPVIWDEYGITSDALEIVSDLVFEYRNDIIQIEKIRNTYFFGATKILPLSKW